MSEPQDPTLGPNAQQISVNVVMLANEDGSVWPALDFATIANRYMVRIPLDAAEKLGEHIVKGLREVAAECRRAQAGIIVAQDLDTEGINHHGR